MMCDIIIARTTRSSASPRSSSAIIPGAGGTQRLPRAVGKAKAMDLVALGADDGCAEAERAGLSRASSQQTSCWKRPSRAATCHCCSIAACRDDGQGSNQPRLRVPAHEGMLFERRLFHSLFATSDQKERMAAFVEKRPAQFRHS